MATSIGKYACSFLLEESFCNESLGEYVGWGVVGSVSLALLAISKFCVMNQTAKNLAPRVNRGTTIRPMLLPSQKKTIEEEAKIPVFSDTSLKTLTTLKKEFQTKLDEISHKKNKIPKENLETIKRNFLRTIAKVNTAIQEKKDLSLQILSEALEFFTAQRRALDLFKKDLTTKQVNEFSRLKEISGRTLEGVLNGVKNRLDALLEELQGLEVTKPFLNEQIQFIQNQMNQLKAQNKSL